MFIDLKGLAEGTEYTFSENFKPENSVFYGRDAAVESIEVKGRYTILDKDTVRVEGSVEAMLNAECDLCLKALSLTVKADFVEIFTPDGRDDTYTYEGFRVDLDDMLGDYLNNNIPSKLLCSEDCKGLCHICGADLNEKDCGCVMVNSPFEILKTIAGGAENGSTKKKNI